MSRILIPSRGPGDWRDLLADPAKHWRAGYSAMAAAHSWEAADGLPPEIAALFCPGAELIFAIPEHKVPMPGRGRDSQCDIFALIRTDAGTVATAIEAKVSEPFGPTIADWLVETSREKLGRLASIRELVGCEQPRGDLRYQLFHRTAAAVLEAERMGATGAAMIVQSFSHGDRWRDDFNAFADFLGATPGPRSVRALTLPGGKILTLGWARGDERFLADSGV